MYKYLHMYVSCHNQVQEDPIITQFDPQATINSRRKNNLQNFYHANYFLGSYNSEKSLYNDDYVLKLWANLVFLPTKKT